MSKASEAIDQSIAQDEIVHIDMTDENDTAVSMLLGDLLIECDDHTSHPHQEDDGVRVAEYWGVSDGDTWRVHVSTTIA